MKSIFDTYDKSKLIVGLFAASLLVVAASSICILFTGQSNTTGHQLLDKLHADFGSQSHTTYDLKASLDFSGHSLNGQLSESVEKGTRFRFASTPVATSEQSAPPPQPAPFPQAGIYAMGANTFGQLGIGTGVDTNTPVQLAPINQWGGPAAIGPYHMIASDSESLLWFSGDDSNGQLGNGPASGSTMAITSSSNPPYPNVRSTAVGYRHSLIVMDDGKVMAAGQGSAGQLGDGLSADTDVFVAVMDDGDKVVAIGNNSFVVKKNSSLWAFGENLSGQLGTGNAVQQSTPVQIDPAGVVSVAGGANHTLYLMDDGAVFAMGYNSYGQFGDATTDSSFSPKKVILSGVKQIAAGDHFSLFRMDDGSLQGVGLNSSGQIGTGDTATQSALVTIIPDGVVDIAAGASHAMFVKDDGTLWGMGSNSNGQLGVGDFSPRLTATQIPGASSVADVTAGFNSTLYMTRTLSFIELEGLDHGFVGSKINFDCYARWSDGRRTLVTKDAVWSSNSGEATFMQNTGSLQLTTSAPGLVTVTATYYGLTITKDVRLEHIERGTKLMGCGKNSFSQLGADTVIDQATPILVDIEKVISSAGGSNHTLYIRGNGSVWAAGDNTYGQLGTSDTIPRTTPIQVMSGGALRAVAGSYHSLIVMQDGSLWAMGRNDEGQLGDGTQFNRNVPTLVKRSGVDDAAAGAGHSIFLAGGSLYGMGRGLEGQLGNNSTSGYDKPTLIYNGDVQHIAAGLNYTLILDVYGSLYGTGDNTFGQLGLISSVITQLSPTYLAGNVKEMIAGGYHSMYVSGSNLLYLTGRNTNGQLGNGDTGGATVYGYTLLSGYTGVEHAIAGDNFTIFGNHTMLYAMGDNISGQFGNGTFNSVNILPVTLPHQDLDHASAGGSHTLLHQAVIDTIEISGLKKAISGKVTNYDCISVFDNGMVQPITDSTIWSVSDSALGSISVNGVLTTNAGTAGSAQVVSAVFGTFTDSLTVDSVDLNIKSGILKGLGRNDSYQLGDSSDSTPHTSTFTIDSDVAMASGGDQYSMYVKADGSLWATGYGFYGQLGTGDSQTQQTPVKVVAADVIKVSCGSAHTMFIKTDGSLWAMGLNTYGQLGDGSLGTNAYTPKMISRSGVIDVSAGSNHTMFLKSNGSLWLMGDNTYGQLGVMMDVYIPSAPPAGDQPQAQGEELGPTPNLDKPFMLVDGGVSSIAAGETHSLYVRNGVLLAMGDNSDGQLGLGTIGGTIDIPLEIVSSNIKAVSAGSRYSLFLRTDGALFGMGANSSSQLGQGATSNAEPTPLFIESGVVEISSGIGHNIWSLADQSVRSCGENDYAQTGIGFTSVSVDSPITTFSGPIFLAQAGSDQTFVLEAVPSSINITGPSTVNETDTAVYTCLMTMSDFSTIDVTDSASWSIDVNGSFSANILTTNSVTSDTAAIITANYAGFVDTLGITVKDVTTLVGLTIAGPTTVNETDTAAYMATALWSDSTTTNVSGLASWVIDTSGTFSGNVLTAASVAADTAAIITASYSGQNDTHNVTIKDVPTVVSIAISGPIAIFETDSATYSAIASWSDSTTSNVSGIAAWSIDTAGSFTGNTLTADSVASDAAAIITATFGGQAGNYNVTVRDLAVASVQIMGPGSVPESDTAVYSCVATMTDSSTVNVTESTTFTIDTGGSFSGNTLTTASVTSDVAAIITASYNGQNDTHSVTIFNVQGSLVRIRVLGPDNVNESSTASFQCLADFSDGTTRNVTSAATWIQTSPYATIDANTGTLTTVSVIGDWPTLITTSFSGQNANKAATIIDMDPMAMIYVDKLASSTVKNGTSWEDAFNELRDAMLKAGPGTEIWVAAGTYMPDAGHDRMKTFGLTTNMKIYGGFTGGETAVAQRNHSANVTILSGDIGRAGDRFDNSFHVVVGADGAIIDGFTIRDGRAYFTPPPSNSNGDEGTVDTEPAIDPLEQMTPSFVPVYFNANDVGGGMINDGVSPIIRNCTFINNDALYGGGAMYNQNNAAAIEECTLANNHSDKWGGAMFNTDNAAPTITRTTFMANSTNVSGGALMSSAGASPVITRCYFKQNYAGRDGGATISNFSNISFTNCVFWKNHARSHAGAVINNDSTPTFTHCTLAENSAGISGGAFESNRSTVTVTNSIIWGNDAAQMPAFHPRWESILVLSYCVIDDTNLPGTGIIHSTPVFTDAALGDLTLQADSPAIDTGTGAEAVDITGASRDGSPDIGAYEYNGDGIGTGDGAGGGTTTPTTTTGGSSDGGGCTLGVATPAMMLPLLMVLAGLTAFRRRRKGE